MALRLLPAFLALSSFMLCTVPSYADDSARDADQQQAAKAVERPARTSAKTPQETWARIEKNIGPDCSDVEQLSRTAVEPVRLPWRKVVVRREPTVLELHRSLACLEAPLLAPVDVVLECDLLGGPQLELCRPTRDVRPDVARVAMLRASAYDARVPGDRYPVPPHRTLVPIRIDPAERIAALPRDYTLPPLAIGAVEWTEQPAAEDWQRLFPDYAKRVEREGSVAALCRIADDGRLQCSDAIVSGLPHFFDVIEPAAALYRAAPLLKSGAPSAGRWVLLRAAFKLPE